MTPELAWVLTLCGVVLVAVAALWAVGLIAANESVGETTNQENGNIKISSPSYPL